MDKVQQAEWKLAGLCHMCGSDDTTIILIREREPIVTEYTICRPCNKKGITVVRDQRTR